MEYSEIKKIIKDMEETKFSEVEIEFEDGTRIKMKKGTGNNVVSENINSSNVVVPVVSAQKEVKTVNDESVNTVKSPMIGTFYRKPSPDSKPYVQVGDIVKKGDVLCIIEAMKLMNEIESEFDGVVTEVLVEDGKPVDFGKPLFKIK